MMKPYDFAEAVKLVEDAKHRSRARHDWWETLEHLFRTGRAGQLSSEALSGTLWDNLTSEDLETFNVVLPRLKLQIAQLTARDPRPTAIPLSGGENMEVASKITEAVCEYFWIRSNGTMTLRDMVQDFIVLGNGVAKVDWAYVEEEVELDPADVEEQLNAAVALDAMSALAEGREPSDTEEIRKYLATTEAKVLSDEPYIAYMRPYDLFVPQNSRRIDETRWAAQRLIVPVDELRERFPGANIRSIPLSPDAKVGRDYADGSFADALEEAEVFEFWDARARNLKVFQLGATEALYDGPWPYEHRYMPFIHMANHRAVPATSGASATWKPSPVSRPA
jgi:predicted RNA-binding Zn ribbon-like protein